MGSDSLVGQLVIEVVGFFPTGTSAVEETRYFSSELLISLSSVIDDPKLLQMIRLVKCARCKAIEENSKLVKKWASTLCKQRIFYTLEFMDLYQEGILGLIKALDRFDPERGYKFSTYASFWVKHKIMRLIVTKDKVVKQPVNMNMELTKIIEAQVRLLCEFGREPTEEEIGNKVSPKMTPEKVKDRLEGGHNPRMYSLDEVMYADRQDTWKDLIVSGLDGYSYGRMDSQPTSQNIINRSEIASSFVNESVVDSVLDAMSLKEMVMDHLSVLSKRESLVMRMRYGLDGDDSKTLREVGNFLGLTRERIRQIELIAINKLKSSMRKSDGKLRRPV